MIQQLSYSCVLRDKINSNEVCVCIGSMATHNQASSGPIYLQHGFINQKSRYSFAMVKTFGVKSLDPFPNRDMASSFLPSFLPSSPNGWMALEVLLRLRPRKYKYNAYSITSADVLSRSISLIIEYVENVRSYSFIAKLTRPRNHSNQINTTSIKFTHERE